MIANGVFLGADLRIFLINENITHLITSHTVEIYGLTQPWQSVARRAVINYDVAEI